MIKLLALDVDGTLSDGKIYMDDKDNALKAFNVKDGFIITQWIKYGGIVAIITGKSSNIVKRRKEELGIQEISQDVSNKVRELKKITDKYGIKMEEVAYVGDDINDLGVMSVVGFSACPKDSAPEVIDVADFVSSKDGGYGAIREILEKIMKENGMWDKVISHYLSQKNEI